jgi:hypothetical protein
VAMAMRSIQYRININHGYTMHYDTGMSTVYYSPRAIYDGICPSPSPLHIFGLMLPR